ncbi:MAG: 2-dehydro-3-deoxy-6-phosphogalactonate aldolase [Candidatus Pacebacteria bacterium]|nr:2-dehydro-3-deoxy-6-phosphogalactonate aldolase [Candidatus Paceibacterota bacterium]
MNQHALADVQQDLERAPVIAILRGVTPDSILPVCEALAEAGVQFIEVTMNSPEPLDSIRKAADSFADRGIHVGAGTVLKPTEVDAVAEAGGTYIISPNTNPEVIRRTKALGLVSIPGFLTPSEAFEAVEAGADLLKCFPAGQLGPSYMKDLRAVLPTPVIAVGGVNLDNVQDYLQAGAAGVGVGSALYKPTYSTNKIREDAATFLARATQ